LAGNDENPAANNENKRRHQISTKTTTTRSNKMTTTTMEEENTKDTTNKTAEKAASEEEGNTTAAEPTAEVLKIPAEEEIAKAAELSLAAFAYGCNVARTTPLDFAKYRNEHPKSDEDSRDAREKELDKIDEEGTKSLEELRREVAELPAVPEGWSIPNPTATSVAGSASVSAASRAAAAAPGAEECSPEDLGRFLSQSGFPPEVPRDKEGRLSHDVPQRTNQFMPGCQKLINSHQATLKSICVFMEEKESESPHTHPENMQEFYTSCFFGRKNKRTGERDGLGPCALYKPYKKAFTGQADRGKDQFWSKNLKPAIKYFANKSDELAGEGEEANLSDDGSESLCKIAKRIWKEHTDYKKKVQGMKDAKDAKKAYAEKQKVTVETMINLRPDGKGVHAPSLEYEMTPRQRKALGLLSESNSSSTTKKCE
jgi:hypothetical protein